MSLFVRLPRLCVHARHNIEWNKRVERDNFINLNLITEIFITSFRFTWLCDVQLFVGVCERNEPTYPSGKSNNNQVWLTSVMPVALRKQTSRMN